MPPNISSAAVFVAHGLTKVYRMGEVEVHALRGIDLVLSRGEMVVLLGNSHYRGGRHRIGPDATRRPG